MSAGSVLDRELTKLNRVAGTVCFMVTRKQLVRRYLVEIVTELRRIADAIEQEVLT